jgi:hypothetical protein
LLFWKVWGGKDKKGACGDRVLCCNADTGEWSEMAISSDKKQKKKISTPAPRWGHTATVIRGARGTGFKERECFVCFPLLRNDKGMLVFGGRDAHQV